ncbi:MAG: copper chaperone PCu(A)C [Corynebacterium sp.]|nr:copper chaperone PCu(A)C [Corynebacterium sp.]
MRTTSLIASATALTLALAGLSACSAPSQKDSTMASQATSAAATATSAGQNVVESNGLEFTDWYAKAKPEGNGQDNMMTGIFGTITNTTDAPIHVVKAMGSLDADMFQIHKMENGVMSENTEGVTIAPGESFQFVPGGDHVMAMGYAPAIEPGDSFAVTLVGEDGTEYTNDEIMVRSIASNIENYGPDGQAQMHDSMNSTMTSMEATN